MPKTISNRPRSIPQVMVSSTFTDLQEHRAALIDAIHAHKFHANVMENDSARLVDVIDSSLQMVRDSAAYIGVLSLKYGQTPECPTRNPDKLSITELEFNEAQRLGRPILLFIMGEDHPVKKADIEKDPEKERKLNAFRERAKKSSPGSEVNRVFAVFDSLPEFKDKLGSSLPELKTHLDSGVDNTDRDNAILTPPAFCAEPNYNGLVSVSTGIGRDDAFQAIRARAEERIIIVGVGMTKISMYAIRTLTEQARSVPINFLMIDPEFLQSDSSFAAQLQDFLDIRDFAATTKSSYTAIRDLVRKWNTETGRRHQFRVYRTIPTMSMVMIDPETETGEAIIEFFLYKSGEKRLRFHVRKTTETDSLFAHMQREYLRLWDSARIVI